MKIIIITAHPDDETFSMAGTLAGLKDKNLAIKLICATRGEAGMVGDPPLCLPEELGDVRTDELKCAAKIENIKKIFFLGLRDGTLGMFKAQFISNLISPILKREEPDVVITLPPSGISGHPDHIMVSESGTLAFENYLQNAEKKIKLYYATIPQSMILEMRKKGMMRDLYKTPAGGSPDEKITIINDIKKTLPDKIKALKCHKTQHQDWERFIGRLDKGFGNFEYFSLVSTNLKIIPKKEVSLLENLLQK